MLAPEAPSTTPTASASLEGEINELGRSVFEAMGNVKPRPYESRYWSNLLMGWSMKQADFKVNLFRLVDVLPTLPNSAAIAEHVYQYLSPPLAAIHPALSWALGLSRAPLLAGITAMCVKIGVKQMSGMFIAGDSPRTAAATLRRLRKSRFAFTVDLLGEYCVSEGEALDYQSRYLDALDTFARELKGQEELVPGHPGESTPVCISVKLSALYSQTNVLNSTRSVEVLSERLSEVVRRARAVKALVYVDAEDSGTNSIIYEAFKRVFLSPEFIDFPLPGIVIQAYAKGAEGIVREMLECARARGSRIAIRLVKGAYWDFERVVSAQNHWDFPLWQKKESTDAVYERLSRILLDNTTLCLPAFGSHNVRSLAHACCYAKKRGLSERDFEIQVLYGMAEPIATAFLNRGYLVRMYVPLGEILPGMGYFVRRLLENTSNESFLRHTFFEKSQVERLLRAPCMQPEDIEQSDQPTTANNNMDSPLKEHTP
jgi:RHH-type proline utilization regulon transcriptional repressor/proline dehydrogenase/delta 1-pyrroline-5-carboxylate dehydrogenase